LTAEPVINTNIEILSDITNEAITANNKSSTECIKIIDKKSNKINSILIKSINGKSVSVNEEERLTK